MHIGCLLFSGLTQLDLTGPLQALSRIPGVKTHIVAKSRRAVPTDCAFSILPTVTFERCPPLDVLLVPGGTGVADAINDAATVAFIRSRATVTAVLASVCTGAFLLGAAGLLRGKRATTHWAYRDLLPEVGAIPVPARVVTDNNVVTCAGVSAGLDAALSLIALLSGAEVAQAIQLSLEYDPAPEFQSGSPEKAEPFLVDRLRGEYRPRLRVLKAALAAHSVCDAAQAP